uniref:Uncharacterized protein n=1 Tax=Sphaerodactylus townsendi TaxID=933632 RepID=A0ACB8EUK0_9SAUR
MSQFQKLMDSTIPNAREVLRDNYKNLLKVADYCESNYEGAQDKRKALEETMAFTTQSLASLAQQISTLAQDILGILDMQAAEVRQVEGDICSVAQVSEKAI